jgi:hypothetical protein
MKSKLKTIDKIGMFLGDAFPDLLTSLGIVLVIDSGVIVAWSNR